MVRKTLFAACSLIVILLFLWGCSGNGMGLNEFGRPLTAQKAELSATYPGLKAALFDPQCTVCHFGPSAAGQLDLSGPGLFTRLTGAGNFSREKPGLRLVVPGRPDSSYLYLKTIGTGIVEARMPKDRAPLTPAELDSLGVWILNGALEQGN